MRPWLGVALVLGGCDAAEDDGPAARIDGGAVERTCLERFAELSAQCPPGSDPSVETADTLACGGRIGAEIGSGDGVVSGICGGLDGCLVACNFQDPCQCGIDRITDEGVFCAPCVTGCGNGVCEGGESPESCPEDCGSLCAAGAERCAGDDREICEVDGEWGVAACRRDQGCEALANLGRTFCQTRLSPDGGSYEAPGALPFEGDGDPLAIRFRQPVMGCDANCELLRFVEGGARVLLKRGDRLSLLDPSTGATEDTGFSLGGAFAVTEDHLASSARQPVVVDRARATTFTADAFVDDTTELASGAVALTADGAGLAVAMAVEGSPLVALWETGAGDARHLLRFVDADVASNLQASALAFSANGRLLAEGRGGGLVVLWNVEEGRYVHLIQTDLRAVTALAFDPTGAPRLLVVGGDGAEMWDIERARRDWTRRVAANRGVFSPDGQALMLDGSLRRADDGSEVRRLDGGAGVHFSPDGHRVIVGREIYADAL